jgi:hypothetical protein
MARTGNSNSIKRYFVMYNKTAKLGKNYMWNFSLTFATFAV